MNPIAWIHGLWLYKPLPYLDDFRRRINIAMPIPTTAKLVGSGTDENVNTALCPVAFDHAGMSIVTTLPTKTPVIAGKLLDV